MKTMGYGSGRRKALVVEDNEINREMLKELLSAEYEVLTASNGREGLEVLEQNYRSLSIVLLDVVMPEVNGFEFMERVRNDALLSTVPIIVTTGSNKPADEEKCLELGAADFVTKPYNPRVVLARVKNTIKLRESSAVLSAVEFDALSGTYSMQAFEHHAVSLLKKDDRDYDLLVLGFRRFSLVNSAYGRFKGDEVLEYAASCLRMYVPDSLIARRGNLFFVLYPSEARRSFAEIEELAREAIANAPIPDLSIKCGIYENVDRSVDPSLMCERAAIASMTIADDYTKTVAVFDSGLLEKQELEQKLESSFEDALARDEFVIMLQPKVRIGTGEVVAAEALVRWITSDGQFISPGAFIPLFERDGLIGRLDEHVFRKVCAIQGERISRGLPAVPVSVNLSRNSLFVDRVVEKYAGICKDAGVPTTLVPIEITESAAVNVKGTLEVCQAFVDAGFALHMDDFGAGYSSISSLGTFPFSVLKIDKSVIDHIGSAKGEILIRNFVDTAKDLGMEIVAEGAEERSQVEFLASVGCDLIQGYFYSAPVKVESFGALVDDGRFDAVLVAPPEESSGDLSLPELRRFLKVCRSVFPKVILLDGSCMTYRLAEDDGGLGDEAGACFEMWSRHERCENCVARRAMETRGSAQKFELFGDEMYHVIAKYITVEGKPHVIEMFNPVGSEVLHGFREEPQLISALTTAERELYVDAQLDIYNRRFYEEKLASLPNVTAVAMVDIDLFKSINDSFGHHIGDDVLRAAVAAIKARVRRHDAIVRYGGDEIIVAFTGMKREFFAARLDEIRKAIESATLEQCPEAKFTATIGGHYCGEFSWRAVVEADRQMYYAKQLRNSVSVSYAAEPK